MSDKETRYEKTKTFLKETKVKFEAMCVKLDEKLPRKSYLFLALMFCGILDILMILF